MRLIDADALIEKCGEWYVEEGPEDGFIGTIKQLIDTQPTIQPERKTGRWIPDNTDYYRTKFICSVCGESEEVPTTGFGYGTMWGYCPNCGAKMKEGEQK